MSVSLRLPDRPCRRRVAALAVWVHRTSVESPGQEFMPVTVSTKLLVKIPEAKS